MATQTVTPTAPEARSGLDPWRIGELPRRAETARSPVDQRSWSRRDRARGFNRQRRIPAWPSSVCEIRSFVALGRGPCGTATDAAQRRTDALHDGDRRARRHRLHADATNLHLLGLVLCGTLFSPDGMARLGGRRGGRSLLSGCEAFARRWRGGNGLRHRRRSLSTLWTDPAGWTTYRAHARISQLDHGRGHHRRAGSTRHSLCSSLDVGRCAGGLCRLRREDGFVSIRSRRG